MTPRYLIRGIGSSPVVGAARRACLAHAEPIPQVSGCLRDDVGTTLNDYSGLLVSEAAGNLAGRLRIGEASAAAAAPRPGCFLWPRMRYRGRHAAFAGHAQQFQALSAQAARFMSSSCAP